MGMILAAPFIALFLGALYLCLCKLVGICVIIISITVGAPNIISRGGL